MSGDRPGWIKDGAVSTEMLKTKIISCADKLCHSSPKTQREGADQLYNLIMCVWSLETHLARDAADLVCDEIR